MSCHDFQGAFQHPEVVIGWFPYRALVNTEVRTAPGACGIVNKVMHKGATCGYQSARNPGGKPDPPRRLPVIFNDEKWVWIYTRAGCVQGWVRLDNLVYDPNPNLNALTGPGGYDFEVGRTLPREKKPNGCGHVSLNPKKRAVSVKDTYLRYSARGTAFHYLHRGDVVKLLLVNGPAGFAFVEVVSVASGSAAKVGSRGWLLHTAVDLI